MGVVLAAVLVKHYEVLVLSGAAVIIGRLELLIYVTEVKLLSVGIVHQQLVAQLGRVS